MKLTQKQREICKYLIQGKSNNEIAKEMFLSTHTIKMHVSNIINTLKAKNRTHAAYILGKTNIINL